MRRFIKRVSKCLPFITIGLTAALLILGLALPVGEYVKLGLYIAALIVIGAEPLIKSFQIFRTHSLDENVLMLIAAVGAFVLGEYAEGVTVLLLSAIGEMFENYAVNKSRKFISQIVEMRTPYANVWRDGEFVKTEPEEVKVGEILLVKPGERIPLDGVITEGETTLDTSSLTGESLPREARAGDEVVSGCINLSAAISLRAEKAYEDSTVAKILDMVETGTAKKAKTQNFITRFARYYTPIVVILAVIVAVIPPLFDGMQWSKWVYKALSFLVISCPCALVISVPLSFFRGIGLASKQGILIKGSNYIEKLARLKAVACDKTGTLTYGNFAIAETYPSEGMTEEELLNIARRIECGSNHPIAKSISRGTAANGTELFEELSGKGIKAVIDGKEYFGGNARLMEENGVSYEVVTGAGTAVYFSEGDRYLGAVLVKDEIKDDSYQFVGDLRRRGVERVVMLSGDTEAVCAETAANLGIAEYHSGLLPQDKTEYLEKIKGETRGALAYVGDGINDAPCLAIADVGISMGGLGSDIAIETSDVVIMEDKPTKVAEAASVSRRTVKIAYENIVFSLGVKIAAMLLALFGVGNILVAIFADVGVSLIAICNAIRPMLKKKKR